MVVVADGANAEFGRSQSGFVNVITKSGTNDVRGTAHFVTKPDSLSSNPKNPNGTEAPKFNANQNQLGFTVGGPFVRDKIFYFGALDIQKADSEKQNNAARIEQRVVDAFAKLGSPNENGPIKRTNDARVLLLKTDWAASARNLGTLRYNYTWSEQKNGTFDVDSWGRSANGLEQSHSHAVNGSLVSFLSSRTSNEFRFQFSREDRPRPYDGPNNHRGDTTGVSSIFGAGVPFHDTDIDPTHSFRFGLPFFLPIRDDHDTRVQLLDNVSFSLGNHLMKLGGEWNRTSTTQVFVGFAGGRMAFTSVTGFINFVHQGSHYVECRNATLNRFYGRATGVCDVVTDTI